jgi:oxidoreductase
MEKNRGLRAIIIGSTGAIGRELTEILLKNTKWESVTVVARRHLERWDGLDDLEKAKLKVLEIADLNFLTQDGVEKYFTDGPYDSVFCCLGSRTGKGKEEFVKVDYTYVLHSAMLCVKLNIPHFGLVSSAGADAKSWFLYMRTKGEADLAVLKLDIPSVRIYRPGLLVERDNDFRIGEKILGWVPFVPKVTTEHVAKVMASDAEDYLTGKFESEKKIIEHKDIVKVKF